MGLLTDLIYKNRLSAQKKEDRQVAGLKSVLDPQSGATPEARDWALENLIGLAGMKGKNAAPVKGLFARLLGHEAGGDSGGSMPRRLSAPQMPERRVEVRPPATVDVGSPIPSLPNLGLTPVPGVTEATRSMFYTPEEIAKLKAQASGMDTEADLDAKERAAARRRQLVMQHPDFEKLTPAQKFEALYPETRMGNTAAGISNIPGTVAGASLKAVLTTDTAGNPIDPTKQYRITRNASGEIIAAYEAAFTPAMQSGEYVKLLNEQTGQPEWAHIWYDPRTRRPDGSLPVMGIQRGVVPPANYLPSTSVTETFIPAPQQDGSTILIPITRSTTRIPGGALLGPVPGAPSPTGGATVNIKGGQVIGGRPLSPEEKKLQENAASGLTAIRRMREMIGNNRSVLVLAALPGSPFAREFNAVRGEAIDVITRLRTGAQLNEQEESFYKRQFPGLLDLTEPAAIEAKLSMYENLFRRFMKRGSTTAGAAAQQPQHIRVRLADGRTGTIDAAEFDAKTMTRLE